MGLETGTYISDLVTTSPTSGDPKTQGDDHIRWIKSAIKATFVGITGAVNATHTFLNNLYAGQLQFPAAQNASADPNCLDDYEEGTFTPTLTFGGGATGLTFSTRNGTYTKIGNTVHVRIYVLLSAKGSSTGGAVVGGLPFAAAAIPASANGTLATWCSALSSISGQVQALIGPGLATVQLFHLGIGAPVALNETNFTNSSDVVLTGTYFV